jgi:hypothetical protein
VVEDLQGGERAGMRVYSKGSPPASFPEARAEGNLGHYAESAKSAISSAWSQALPSTRKNLPVELDALGKPIERGNPFNRFSGLTDKSKRTVEREILKLRLRLPVTRMKAPTPGNPEEPFDRTAAQYMRRRQVIGDWVYKALSEEIAAPGYRTMSKADKQELLQAVIKEAQGVGKEDVNAERGY